MAASPAGRRDRLQYHRAGLDSVDPGKYHRERLGLLPLDFRKTRKSAGAGLAADRQFYIFCYSINTFSEMIHNILKDRPTKLFLGFTAFFCCNGLIAEAIATKLFSLEKLFGLHPVNFTLFGQSGLAFTLTCGVLLWPLEFVMTDIINEFYGPRAVRRISYTAVILISYAFVIYFLTIHIPPADV